MEKNKELEEIKEVNEEVTADKQEMVVSGFDGITSASKTQKKYFTTIDLDDYKTLYNLDNGEMDHLLNDCEGQSIRVKDVLIKEFVHELETPEVDENGEVTKDVEVKKVCILIDDAGETYVTASKMFTNQMKRFIALTGIEAVKNGLEIKIVKKKMQDSSNKALGFELI